MPACNCKRKCIAGSCTCIDTGLRCSEACLNQNCDNMDDENDSEDDGLDGGLAEFSDDDDDYFFD